MVIEPVLSCSLYVDREIYWVGVCMCVCVWGGGGEGGGGFC